MKHNYRFESKRIILRPLEWEDIGNLRALRNENRHLFLTTDLVTEEGQKKWYERYLEKQDDLMFVVEKREKPGQFIGTVALYDIDWDTMTCEFGRTLIDKKLAPEKGIGTEATAAMCTFGFDVLKIKKIIGHAWKTNERILKVDQRAGYQIIEEREDGVIYLEMTSETVNRSLVYGE